MSTTLYYNNAYAQSGIKYSSKDFLFRITATNALKDKRRGHSLTVNSVYTQSNSKEQHLRNSGGLQRLFMQRRSSSSSSNSRLLFSHTLTKRHLERLWKKNFMQSSCRSAWRPRQDGEGVVWRTITFVKQIPHQVVARTFSRNLALP